MQRLKNAQAKWLSIAEKERAFNVREVLRAQPLDVRAYAALMDFYKRHEYGMVLKEGRIRKPETASQ
jgi:hypothetical protein